MRTITTALAATAAAIAFACPAAYAASPSVFASSGFGKATAAPGALRRNVQATCNCAAYARRPYGPYGAAPAPGYYGDSSYYGSYYGGYPAAYGGYPAYSGYPGTVYMAAPVTVVAPPVVVARPMAVVPYGPATVAAPGPYYGAPVVTPAPVAAPGPDYLY
jgi:hypothetical protein